MIKSSEVTLSPTLQKFIISALSMGIGAGGMKLYDYLNDKKKEREEQIQQIQQMQPTIDPFMIQR